MSVEVYSIMRGMDKVNVFSPGKKNLKLAGIGLRLEERDLQGNLRSILIPR